MDAHVHSPVMLQESLDQLNIKGAGCYVDCTFGRGGHSKAILERLSSGGRLIAIDRDPDAIEFGEQSLDDPRFNLYHANFGELTEVAERYQFCEHIDGIFADLGVSSPQLDSPARGFSFQNDGPLDMRMDPTSGISAAEWLRTADEKTIAECLLNYGEERHAKRVARYIVEDREQQAIVTTTQLADLTRRAIPKANRQRIHPATRTFQALRIMVNNELDALSTFLQQSTQLLAVGGRLVVIAFHSLEDRLVKRYFRDICRTPDQQNGNRIFKLPFRKPLRPSDDEQQQNPRARSARLRVIERVA